MSYKDYQSLNEAISHPILTPAAVAFRRLISDCEELVSIPENLPVDWARSYAGVMVLKYDQNGNPTDVTDDVTAHGVDAPNSLVSKVKRRFNESKLKYDQDYTAVSDASWSSEVRPNFPDLDSITTTNTWVSWVPIVINGEQLYFGMFYDSQSQAHWILTVVQPVQTVKSAVLYRFNTIKDNAGFGLVQNVVMAKLNNANYILNISMAIDVLNSNTFAVNFYYASQAENGSTSSLVSSSRTWTVGTSVDIDVNFSDGSIPDRHAVDCVMTNPNSRVTVNTTLGDVVFTNPDAIDNLQAAIDSL